VNTPWRRELGVFTLFDFSAKFDPVPDADAEPRVGAPGLLRPDDRVPPGAPQVGRRSCSPSEEGAAKYVHGNLGEGTWTYFGGHDPEDPEHQIGDPPTDLSLHPNSPGYRLILNNVLFPAARKQKLKTQ
jgi:hypothetical protein